MQVKELWIYPIKSLRGTLVTSADLTDKGFLYDRKWMLLKVHRDAAQLSYENMLIAKFTRMCLFKTSISFPSAESNDDVGAVHVVHTNPEDKSARELSFPLQPDAEHLEKIDVSMHQSNTQAYAMEAKYSTWFTECFGFEVILAYIGSYARPVLGNLAPNAASRNAQRKVEREKGANSSWLPSIASSIASTLGVSSSIDPAKAQAGDYTIGFADCAPYLVVSTKSLENVSSRLPEGEEMDITKFRPNIILSGADEAFEEDYWAQLSIPSRATYLQLTTNCVRCASINVDYATGAPGKGEAGSVLKKLQADRRIDQGHKYSPVFGRYGFLERAGDGGRLVLEVGDAVAVTKRNSEYTVMRWPGFGSTAKDELYPV